MRGNEVSGIPRRFQQQTSYQFCLRFLTCNFCVPMFDAYVVNASFDQKDGGLG